MERATLNHLFNYVCNNENILPQNLQILQFYCIRSEIDLEDLTLDLTK